MGLPKMLTEELSWFSWVLFMFFPKFMSFPQVLMCFPQISEKFIPKFNLQIQVLPPNEGPHHPIIQKSSHPSSPKVPDLRASDHLTDCPMSYHHSCGLGLGHFQQWTLGGHVGPSGSSLGIASWPSCGTTLEALISRIWWAKDGFHGF